MEIKKILTIVLLSLLGSIGNKGNANVNATADNEKGWVPTASFTSTPVCEGNPTVFVNTSTTLFGSIVTNIWDFGDGESSTVLNPQHTFANSGTFSVILTVINSAGDVDTFTDLVVVHPAADLNFLVSAPNNCESSTFTFTNVSNIVLGSITGYDWDFGDGSSSTTATSPTHMYANPGTYTVILTGTTNNSCVDIYSEQVEVYAEPTVDFTVQDACLGIALQLINNTQVASGNLTYLWTFGDTNFSTEINPEHTYLSAGTYSINLTATTEKGCVISSARSVTIHPMPSAVFTANDQCDGTDITFNNSSSISTGTNTYLWTFGDGTTSTDENPVHSYSSPGSYEVILRVTSDQDCMQETAAYVNVNPNPIAAFIATNSCRGSATVFTNGTAISSGTLTYLWQFGDGNTSTSQHPSHMYASSGTFNVTLTVTSDKTCQVMIGETITVFASTAGGIVNGSTQLCEDDNAFYTLTLASNVGEVVRWESSTTGLDPWSTIQNTTNLLTYSDLAQTTHFRAAVRNGSCDEMNSQIAMVTIDELTVGGSLESTEVCATANSATLTLTGHTGDIIEWQQTSDPLGIWTPITNTTTTQSYMNLSNTTFYRVLVQNGVCSTDMSSVAQVLVHPSTVAGILSSSATACKGDNLGTLTLTSYTGAVIRWENAPTLNGPWSVINLQLDQLNYTDLTLTTYFRVVVASGVCDELESNTVRISIDEVTESGDISGESQVCFGINSGELTLENAVGTILGWESSPNGFNTWSGLGTTDLSISFSNLIADTYYRVQVQNGSCTAEYTNSFKVTVSPLPLLSFASDEVCFGIGTSFTNTSTINSGSLQDYFWDFGNGVVSVSPSPTYSFPEAGSMAVKLKITSNLGCIDSLTQSVVVNPKPNVDFNVANACFGEPLMFNDNSNILFGSIAQYEWDFGDGSSSTETNPEHEYAGANGYIVQLTIESDRGCESVVGKTVNVLPRATPDFTVENSCFGQETTLINNTVISEGNVSYLWDFGDGNTSESVNPIYRFAVQGDYNIKLEVTTSQGCIDELIKTVSVFPQPDALFQVNDNCLDVMTVFTNTSIANGADVTYSWDFGDGNISSLENPSHQYISAQTYTVTLTASSSNGCSDSYSHILKVFPLPTADFIVDDVCDTENVIFRNLSSISSGTVSYEWIFGDGELSSDSSPEHLYANDGEYNVTLRVTSDFGCVSVIDKSVSVHPVPVVGFQAPAVCDAEPILFENLSNITTGTIVEYLWDFGDQTNAVVQHPNKEYLNQGTYQVTLSVLSDQGCKASLTQEVTVQTAPIANFSIEDICVGASVQPLNTSNIASGTLTYRWDFGDTNSSVSAEPTHEYNDFGVYAVSLTVTSETGCKDEITRPVIVHNTPSVDAGEDVTVSQGFTTQLEAKGGTNYIWEPITGLSNSNVADPFATPLITTEYSAQVTDRFGCVNSDLVTVFVEEDFKLIANNVLTPDGNGKNDAWVIDNVETFGDVNVRVYDRRGKAVFEQRAYQNDWRGTSGADVLPDGTYYYYITFDQSDKEYRGALTIIRNQ